MATLQLIASIALLHLLAISSPGPTFVVVSKHALAGDRRSGMFVAVGVVLATLTWSAFAATGLGALAATYPRVLLAIQYAGAAYLIYLGIKLLMAFRAARTEAALKPEPNRATDAWRAVGAGYLTNMSNPKVIAYYTSLFGVMLPSNPSTEVFLLIVATVVTVSGIWWSFIGYFFTLDSVRRRFVKARRWIDGVMGTLLVAFGLKLLLSR